MPATVPEISVIVPFYNVEQCVAYCVGSLLEQTYQGGYEVVLVDDGSTDGTGALLDAYADEPRVRVFHKGNGGLSDARNFGVAQSHGRYITFVDGDDFISPHYLDALAGAMGGLDDRIVMGRFRTAPFARQDAFGGFDWTKPQAHEVSSRDAAVAILYDDMQPSACAKLAPRSVYENAPFPTGVRYEEIRTIMSHLARVRSITFLDAPIYAYVMRGGSITWSREASVAQMREYREAIEVICHDALAVFPDLRSATAYQRALLLTRMHSQLPVGARTRDDVRLEDNKAIAELRGLLPSVMRDPRAPKAQAARFWLLAHARPAYDAAYALYKKHVKMGGVHAA